MREKDFSDMHSQEICHHARFLEKKRQRMYSINVKNKSPKEEATGYRKTQIPISLNLNFVGITAF